MSAMALREETVKIPKEKRTFDTDFAVLVLAFSLPLSTLLVMGILSSGTFFANTNVLLLTAFILIGMGLIPRFVFSTVSRLSKAHKRKQLGV
jgi:positive regulator of sigma E activity